LIPPDCDQGQVAINRDRRTISELGIYLSGMASGSGDRSKFFPLIEKKYGQPVQCWFDLLAGSGEEKYDQQMALLQEGHGFSRAHANALVMTHRGSTTTRRFDDVNAYFAAIDPVAAKTARAVFSVMQKHSKDLVLVVAWNQPMLKAKHGYVFGLSVGKNHITMGPVGNDIIATFSDRLSSYRCGKKTFNVAFDWKIDRKLLCDLVDYRLLELE